MSFIISVIVKFRVRDCVRFRVRLNIFQDYFPDMPCVYNTTSDELIRLARQSGLADEITIADEL